MNINYIIQIIAVAVIPLLFAITVHEVAHGWIANKLGDKTALMLGRITLNPFKHIDLIGTILVPIGMLVVSSATMGTPFVFGWAKPVPVNFRNLRNPRRDMALVALAGPMSNLLMAFMWGALAKLSYMIYQGNSNVVLLQNAMTFIHLSSKFGVTINCVLMVLNLVPIPPLDGSRVVSSLLPVRLAIAYDSIEPWGILILITLLVTRVLYAVIAPPIIFLIKLIFTIFGIPNP